MADRDVRLLPDLPATPALYARALMPKRGGRTALPHRLLMVRDHRQDPARLAAYNRVCGFTLRDRVAPTWLHVLTFGLQLDLLAAPDFPVPLAGVVHAANELRLLRPVSADERLTLTCEATSLSPHRRGVMIQLTSRALVADQQVWEGTSHYLALGASVPGIGGVDAGEREVSGQPALPTAGLWRLPANLGRQYAAVSGDHNPIHLNPLVAKAFGFPRSIIHGMWTQARMLAALEPRLPDAYASAVRFAKPILLPSTVRFAAARTEIGFDAEVTDRDGAKRFVTATIG